MFCKKASQDSEENISRSLMKMEWKPHFTSEITFFNIFNYLSFRK